MQRIKYFPAQLSVSTAGSAINDTAWFALDDTRRNRILRARTCLEKLLENDAAVYGVNTGFGALFRQRIPKDQIHQLQHNLLISHACGTGEEVPQEIVKLMMLLKIEALSLGHSGVSVDLVHMLIQLYNCNALPVIYTQGSLGASGDLVPLAHMSLPLIGLGEMNFEGKKQKAKDVLPKCNQRPLELKEKEGLALINGTQFMTAYGIYLLLEAKKLIQIADKCAALSLDAFDCNINPFDELIQKVRPHKGQIECAANIRELLKGSEIIQKKTKELQDPYSFRCVPQVHGAVRDVVDFVEGIVNVEISSVTDNPLIFPDENRIISGGNFHGEPLALAFDQIAIALSELGSISERRTYQLISGQRGLPVFLSKNPGINSGFMIPQYTAAALVSQNKQLSTPASVDSIVSSNGQEDHVSMGANAATKAFEVVKNLYSIFAIELMTGAQALEFRRPSKSSNKLEGLVSSLRETVPFVEKDVLMHELLNNSKYFLQHKTLIPDPPPTGEGSAKSLSPRERDRG